MFLAAQGFAPANLMGKALSLNPSFIDTNDFPDYNDTAATSPMHPAGEIKVSGTNVMKIRDFILKVPFSFDVLVYS